MNSDIHVGDVGTVIVATMMDGQAIVDVSGSTTKNLTFKKPDGLMVTKPALFSTDGTDGQIQYVSEAGFFDQSGKWRLQAFVGIPAGQWTSNPVTFEVKANL